MFFPTLLYILIIFWTFRILKSILFWLYLWQLKEYHIGRFLDHFRTEKGKNIFINLPLFLKFIFAAIFLFALSAFWVDYGFSLDFLLWVLAYLVYFLLIVFVLYFLDFIYVIASFLRRSVKRPILTKKTFFLFLLNITVFSGIFYYLSLSLFHYQSKLGFNLAIPLLGKLPFSFIIFSLSLLILDLFSPLVISLIVLAFQPLAVLGRNRIIRLAKIKRGKFKNLLVVGITGSYGKTSTKEFLYAILVEKFGGKVLKTKEHQNSEVGISQCILNDLKPHHEVFVCEMGAYGRGGIKLLCGIVKPKIGILSGINEQHMATFGSQKNIIKTKYELIESLPDDGVAFFNAKNEYCLKLYERTKIKKFLYGKNAAFPGEENILGAMAVARELGMTDEEIFKAAEKIKNRFGGIQLKQGVNGLKIVEADYSANPTGTIAHLEYLKTLSGKKVIIMPCLIELGKASKEVHKIIGRGIGEACALAIIVTKDRFEDIKEGAIEKGMKEESILFMEDPKTIIEKIQSFCEKGDTVLLEGRLAKEIVNSLQEKSASSLGSEAR